MLFHMPLPSKRNTVLRYMKVKKYVDTSEGAVIEIDIYHHDSTNEHWKLKVNGGNSIRFNDEAYRNSTYEEVQNSMYDGFEYCTLVYGEGRNCTAGMEVVFAMQMASGWHKPSQKTKHFTWRTLVRRI